MSRIERKKAEKEKPDKVGRKIICIFLICCFLIFGIKTVDDAFRMMMLIEEPQVFGHQKLNEDLHQFYLCGEKLLLNEEDIREAYGYLKNEMEVFLKLLKDKKEQFVKND